MSDVAEQLELTLEEKRGLAARLLRQKAGRRPEEASPVHRSIETQAERTPEGIALGCAHGSLTYFELNARANRLARRLRAIGVGPEVVVGLCLGRSADMVVALLAVLKAGGAYLPLDPAMPVVRLAFMLGDAHAAVLLTEEKLRGRLPDCEARVLCIDAEAEAIDAQSSENIDGGAGASNLAYEIYTSGSTGKPKGVEVTHAALANLLKSMRGLLSMSARDTLLAVTTLSFDIAALEILLPLSVGGCVELIDRDVAANGARLADRLDDPRITFLQATPATWRMLLEAGWQGKPTLTMLCGGETLPRSLANQLLEKGAALWNVYGPTETTIWSSAWRVEAGEGPISIGRPIAKTRLYVLDKRLRTVPIGVVGELYIAGAGLARGYRDRPGLTAERFVPDPFGAMPGGRLYRSGDLARWWSDGTLECLGRVDHQVKIRGFRVELHEVETALARHPAVREAVVAARPDPSGETSLAAYIAPHERPNPNIAAELRRWLVELIPDYMVPSAFVFVDAFPRTPNGKIDRHALPEPGRAWLPTDAEFVPARGPIEDAVVELWTVLLGADSVGVHDNFFERGGHSLQTMQLLARLRQTFDVEVPLNDFLEDPTVSRLARLIERALATKTAASVPPLVPVQRDRLLPASFAQERLWFLDQLEPGRASYHIPAAVKLVGQLDIPALERALNEVVRRHEALRTVLAAERGIPRQVIAARMELPLAVQDWSCIHEDRRDLHAQSRIREEAERPFDLARGPLVRAALLRYSEQESVAMVTMHHAISDGWSIGVLMRELTVLYQSYLLNRPSPHPEPAIQYADYAVWQRNWLQGAVLEAQLDYWTRQVAGVPDLELPTDRPRPPVTSGRGDERSTTLPKTTVDAARALGRSEGATLYMTLLATFQLLLSRYSCQDDFAVGTPIAGRTLPELEGLIGFFANTLVMRADLSGAPGFRELLRRIRRTSIDAYTHQDLPFEKLLSVVHRHRDASRTPLFQVMFALQNLPFPALEIPDLLLTPLEISSRHSKFDLTLFATEVPEGLRLTMEYSTDLFDAARVDRMLAHYGVLLEEVSAHPDQPVGALRMLTEEERQQMLSGWDTAASDDRASLVDGSGSDDLDSLLYEVSPMEFATDE
jgi:amino acid adenylation domain-containing protein